MNKRRIGIFVTAAVTAFAAGLGFGMWENQNRVHYEAKEAPPQESAAAVSGTAVPTVTNEPTETEAYLLRYVGDRTVVYKILSDGSTEAAFAAEGVRIDMLPDSEREKLKNGIRFDSKEKLYGAIENYSS